VTQVSKLVDMVSSRFGTQVACLAIMDCQLRRDDIIRDVIRDGDVVEALQDASNGNGASSLQGPPVATLTQSPRSTEDSASGLFCSPYPFLQRWTLTGLLPGMFSDLSQCNSPLATGVMPLQKRYRQIRRFKGGVMGTVFKAQDMASAGLYREVVVKLLQTGATRERQDRFMREAKIVAGLQHPNIINYVDMGQERDGTYYIVMEAVNGPDLQLILDQRGFLNEAETLTIVKGVLNGPKSLSRFLKVLYTVTLYGKYSTDLTYENLTDF